MINTISTNQAITELLKDEYADWSHEAATALVDWMGELEESTGEPIEFDPVGLRCEFSEYTATDLMEVYGMTLEEIRDNTIVIEFGSVANQMFVVQEF